MFLFQIDLFKINQNVILHAQVGLFYRYRSEAI